MELAEQFTAKLIHPEVVMEVVPVLQGIEVIGITSTQIDLQMNIDYVHAISSIFLEPCIVELEIMPGQYLNGTLSSSSHFEIVLPRMFDKDFAEAIQLNAERACNAGSFVISVDFLVALFLGISLKSIWSIINILQLIIYASIEIKANLPAHSLSALIELKRIAFFEFIPYKWFYDRIRELS